MSGALVGFESYTPAPEPVEPPQWVLRETLWARIDHECRPVTIDEASAEISAADILCADGNTTTGATDRLRLLHAGHDHATYARVVWLRVVPIGLRGEFQPCSRASLRELEKRGDPVSDSGEIETDPLEVFFPPMIWLGNRLCLFADGFAVEEDANPGLSLIANMPRTVHSVPGRFDCLQPCASRPQLDEYLTHVTTVIGRDFLPPEPRGLEVFRTVEACEAFEGSPPSVLRCAVGPPVGPSDDGVP